MQFLAASFESLLVFVAIIVISGVANWLKQRQAAKEERDAEGNVSQPWPEGEAEPDHSEAHEGAPEPARRGFNWEEELKRLLEGDFGQKKEAEPSPGPTAPPVMGQAGTAPPPVAQARPERMTEQAAAPPTDTPLEAYRRAQELKAKAAKMMAKAASKGFPEAELRRENVVRRVLVGQLRSPVGAQQAILASVILGPPKAFQAERELPGAGGIV